jgi:hypothetical protein
MPASSCAARSSGGLDSGDGGGIVVECADVPAGELDADVGREAGGGSGDELGELPLLVQLDAISATAHSTTPARRMPHILVARSLGVCAAAEP